jgi:hypothetical protein
VVVSVVSVPNIFAWTSVGFKTKIDTKTNVNKETLKYFMIVDLWLLKLTQQKDIEKAKKIWKSLNE